LRDIGVNAAKGLYANRSNGGVVQTLGYGTFLKVGLDNTNVWPDQPVLAGGRLGGLPNHSAGSRPDRGESNSINDLRGMPQTHRGTVA
jgi:hypothetical protein